MPDLKDDILSMIAAKAYVDAPWSKRLTDNPHEALREFDIDVPADLRVSVHEFDQSHWHIMIPARKRAPSIPIPNVPSNLRTIRRILEEGIPDRPLGPPLRPVEVPLIRLAAPPRVPEK